MPIFGNLRTMEAAMERAINDEPFLMKIAPPSPDPMKTYQSLASSAI
jgi:hypothetical protein